MGLDMYAYEIELDKDIASTCDKDILENIDAFNQYIDKLSEKHKNSINSYGEQHIPSRNQFYYWRKHPNLHGWMENLYVKKGGLEVFNCVDVPLSKNDLIELSNNISAKSLPETSGFFFGNSSSGSEQQEYDLEFINNALEKIKNGKIIFYTSWW